MAITITGGTNAQLYADCVAVAKTLRDLKATCEILAERMYFIGIPNHPTPPVEGFVDADNLTTADVMATLPLVLDFRDFMIPGRVQACAQNSPQRASLTGRPPMPLYWVTSATTAAPTGIFDAVELVCPASGLIAVYRVHLWQVSDAGDAQEEMLRVEWVRGNATSGSGGQTTVITPLNSFDVAAGFTAELLNTTPASTGSPVSLAPDGWNIRIPYVMPYPPREWPIARNSERICFRVAAPADAITVNCSCLVEQL